MRLCPVFRHRLLRGLTLVIAVTAVGGGCASAPSSETAVVGEAVLQPAALVLSPREAVEIIERDLRRHIRPEVRVGLVMTIAPQTRGARIADIDTSGLRAGDPVLFVDTAGRSVAAGQLLQVSSDGLIAEYDPTLVNDGRAVRVEDLAVLNLSGPTSYQLMQ